MRERKKETIYKVLVHKSFNNYCCENNPVLKITKQNNNKAGQYLNSRLYLAGGRHDDEKEDLSSFCWTPGNPKQDT